METHQRVAIGLFFGIACLVLLRDGTSNDDTWAQLLVLLVLLVTILCYRIIAAYSGFGIPNAFASDSDSARPEPFAVLFWFLFLLVGGLMVFR